MKSVDSPEPAQIESINSWERFFDVEMSYDLKLLLMESNGPVLYEPFRKKELQFLSTSEAIECYQEYRFGEFCTNAIPVCTDGDGNIVVYKRIGNKLDKLHVMHLSNLDWNDSCFLKDSLTDVINMKERVSELFAS